MDLKRKKKIKKFWEKIFNPDDFHPPKYCPECGSKIPQTTWHRASFWADSSRKETYENPFRGIGYDVYCPSCDWSGDIIPDEDGDKIHNIGKDGKVYEDSQGRDWHREGEE